MITTDISQARCSKLSFFSCRHFMKIEHFPGGRTQFSYCRRSSIALATRFNANITLS